MMPTTRSRVLEGVVIMLVEDDRLSAKLLTTVLVGAGCELHVSADANQATALLLGGLRPDLILLDLDLPGLNGLDFTRMIKARESTRPIPVVAITASGPAFTEGLARAAGCDGFLR